VVAKGDFLQDGGTGVKRGCAGAQPFGTEGFCHCPSRAGRAYTEDAVKVRATIEIGLGFALLALAGCPGGGGVDAGASAQVELGTGTIEWEPLPEDTELDLIAGPQGGHHFIVHARASGIVPGDPARPGQLGNPATTFEAYDQDGNRLDLDFPPYRLGYEQPGDGWSYLPSGRILQVTQDAVPTLPGQRVRVTLRIQDVTGAYGTDEVWIVAREGEVPDGGLPDAGPADAGPTDAAPPDA
jgi:hypothetical protein